MAEEQERRTTPDRRVASRRESDPDLETEVREVRGYLARLEPVLDKLATKREVFITRGALALVSLLFVVVIGSLIWQVQSDRNERARRTKAFCGLVYLFDESIRLQGTKDLGPLQAPYDDWKQDVKVADCPDRPHVLVPPTTTTRRTS